MRGKKVSWLIPGMSLSFGAHWLHCKSLVRRGKRFYPPDKNKKPRRKKDLLVPLTTLAGAAFPQGPDTRQDALRDLGSAEAATRAAAVLWIARNGAPGD